VSNDENPAGGMGQEAKTTKYTKNTKSNRPDMLVHGDVFRVFRGFHGFESVWAVYFGIIPLPKQQVAI
jgi:hypothetical protein